MAKKSYIGINSKAQKIKKVYIGVDGIARKVKKIYMGVLGLARQIFGGGEIVKLDTVLKLNTTHYSAIGTNTSKHAIFASGRTSTTSSIYYRFFEAIDDNFTITVGSENYGLNTDRWLCGNVGEYAFYYGGLKSSSTTYIQTRYITINSKLTGQITELSSANVSSGYTWMINADDYILFCYNNKMYRIDNERKVTTPSISPIISLRGEDTMSTAIGNYILTVTGDLYNESLTRIASTKFPTSMTNYRMSATNSHAIGMGGTVSNKPVADIFTVDKSGTASLLTEYSYPIRALNTNKMNNLAVFWGGADANSKPYGDVIYFDDSLTRRNAENFPTKINDRYDLYAGTTAGAVLNNHLFMAGGRCDNNVVWDGAYVYAYE